MHKRTEVQTKVKNNSEFQDSCLGMTLTMVPRGSAETGQASTDDDKQRSSWDG